MVKKLFFVMLTGMICFSSCFCETAFAKTSKVRVYDAEKGTKASHLLHIRIIKRMNHWHRRREQERFHLLLRRRLFSIRQMGLR